MPIPNAKNPSGSELAYGRTTMRASAMECGFPALRVRKRPS